MKRDYDLIILGGGSAGIVSAVMAGAFKLRTLLIERDRLGGECSNTGCVPSKALLHAASVAHAMRTAGNVGFKGREVTREEAADALRRVREMIEVVREADATQDLLNRYGVEVRKGEAQFVNPREVLPDAVDIALGPRHRLTKVVESAG